MTTVDEGANNAWRERALERSLSSARTRALVRSSKFLAAAMDLLEETGDVDFTVQNIVERSQLSLRSFYQHFGGKGDLLLALYEELIANFVADLRDEVMEPARPIERLERYCKAYLERAELSRDVGGRALSIYHLRLAIDQPADYAKTFEPQVALLREIVDQAIASGDIRHDLSPAQLATLLNTTLMSIAQMGVFGTGEAGAQIGSQEIWAWCFNAIRPLSSEQEDMDTRIEQPAQRS